MGGIKPLNLTSTAISEGDIGPVFPKSASMWDVAPINFFYLFCNPICLHGGCWCFI